MKPSGELFELVKSLSKSEKRYFKLKFSSGKDSNYLKLFNEIDSQDRYNEKEIKQKFRNEKFVKQLTFTKNYLYNNILSSLISYNKENLSETQFLDSVIKLRILFRKALYRQYFKGIKAAKEKAWKYEKFYILLELIRMQRLIVEIKKFRTFRPDELYDEEALVLRKIDNLGKYSALFCKTQYLKRKAGTGLSINEAEAKVLLSDKLLSDTGQAFSTQALEYFNHIKQILYSIKGDSVKEFYYTEKRLECIENNPKPFLHDIADNRKEAIHNLLMLCIELEKKNEFKYYLEKSNSLEPVSSDEKISNEVLHDYSMLQYSITFRESGNGRKAVDKIKQNLKKYKGKIDRDTELNCMFGTAKFFFYMKDYEKALEDINELLAHPLIEYRKDIHIYSKLLNLLIHYELGNFELMEYLLAAAKKLVLKNRLPGNSEFSAVRIFYEIASEKPGHHRDNKILSMREIINTLKGSSPDKKSFYYLDIASWIEEKFKELKTAA